MPISVKRWVAALAAIALVSTLGAAPAFAQSGKSKKAQGTYLSFDAETNTIKVKEKGKERTYHIKPEGSILTRTSVKVNGLGAKIEDVPENSRVIIYWRPMDGNKKERFGRTLDFPSIPEDLREQFDQQS